MDFITGLLNYLKENAPGQREFQVSDDLMEQYLPGWKGTPVPESEYRPESDELGKGWPIPEVGPPEPQYIPEARQNNNGAFGPPRTMTITTTDGRRAMARTDGKGGKPKIIRYLPQVKGGLDV
ncbi:MAG: hypothetical protein EB168_05965 [Euryarchaeota archaeon]|nr:hypothetical protein [Euryarchaeota archaeon]